MELPVPLNFLSHPRMNKISIPKPTFTLRPSLSEQITGSTVADPCMELMDHY